MENDELRAEIRESVKEELDRLYERRLHAELGAMRKVYDESLAAERARHDAELKAAKDAYEFQLGNMIKLCNKRVAEADRKAENLRYGATLYKEYLEEYSRQYGTDVISVTIRDDGLWFLIERK